MNSNVQNEFEEDAWKGLCIYLLMIELVRRTTFHFCGERCRYRRHNSRLVVDPDCFENW